MSRLESLGQFLFRRRNALFPILLVAALVIFPPLPLTTAPAVWLLVVGLGLLVLGQSVRVATIGLDYIKRGGKNGRIFATRLVTGGVFAHCRNPMYVGNILIATGFFGVAGNGYAFVIGAVASFLIYRTIVYSEERYLAREFGDAYTRYCARVPRWIGRPRGLAATLGAHRFDWAAVVIREYGTLFTTSLIVLVILCVKADRGSHLDQVGGWYAALSAVLLLLYLLARYLKKSRRLRAVGS